MSDYYDDENDGNGSNLVSDLRKQLDQATKRANKLESEIADFRKQTRVSTLQAKITERGLDPRVAAIIPSDVEDVDTWLEQFGDLFGAKAPEAANDGGAVDEELDALEQQNQTEGRASDQDGILAAIESTGSLAELEALIKGAH